MITTISKKPHIFIAVIEVIAMYKYQKRKRNGSLLENELTFLTVILQCLQFYIDLIISNSSTIESIFQNVHSFLLQFQSITRVLY